MPDFRKRYKNNKNNLANILLQEANREFNLRKEQKLNEEDNSIKDNTEGKDDFHI